MHFYSEHFFVCKWISGEFGSGEGEEFQPDRNRGVYKPVLIKIADIPSLPLMPPEIATNLVADYELFGENLRDDVIIVNKSEDL